MSMSHLYLTTCPVSVQKAGLKIPPILWKLVLKDARAIAQNYENLIHTVAGYQLQKEDTLTIASIPVMAQPHIPISNCRLKKPKPLTSAPGSKTTNAILFSPAKNIWMRPARVFPSTMTVWQQLFPEIIYWVKRSRSPSPNWETKICFFWANPLCIMIRSRKSAGRRVLNQWLSTQAHTWIIFLTLWAKNTGFPCWCSMQSNISIIPA